MNDDPRDSRGRRELACLLSVFSAAGVISDELEKHNALLVSIGLLGLGEDAEISITWLEDGGAGREVNRRVRVWPNDHGPPYPDPSVMGGNVFGLILEFLETGV